MLWWLPPSSRLGQAGAVLREGTLAATTEVIAACAGLEHPDQARRSADMVLAATTGVLQSRLSPAKDRSGARRDASLLLGAFLETELPSTFPSGRKELHEGGDAPPAVARSDRALNGRQRMLDAAVDRLVADGYGGASTLAIQASAGVSRGRLLHQFPSRDLLLVAAVEHLANQRVRATQRRVLQIVQADRDGPSRIDHVVEEMWASYQELHYWAASELWMAARTNPEIAASLRPHEHRLGATIRTAVSEMFGEPYAADDRFPMLARRPADEHARCGGRVRVRAPRPGWRPAHRDVEGTRPPRADTDSLMAARQQSALTVVCCACIVRQSGAAGGWGRPEQVQCDLVASLRGSAPNHKAGRSSLPGRQLATAHGGPT